MENIIREYRGLLRAVYSLIAWMERGGVITIVPPCDDKGNMRIQRRAIQLAGYPMTGRFRLKT